LEDEAEGKNCVQTKDFGRGDPVPIEMNEFFLRYHDDEGCSVSQNLSEGERRWDEGGRTCQQGKSYGNQAGRNEPYINICRVFYRRRSG
jgi:hypothetical protein